MFYKFSFPLLLLVTQHPQSLRLLLFLNLPSQFRQQTTIFSLVHNLHSNGSSADSKSLCEPFQIPHLLPLPLKSSKHFVEFSTSLYISNLSQNQMSILTFLITKQCNTTARLSFISVLSNLSAIYMHLLFLLFRFILLIFLLIFLILIISFSHLLIKQKLTWESILFPWRNLSMFATFYSIFNLPPFSGFQSVFLFILHKK